MEAVARLRGRWRGELFAADMLVEAVAEGIRLPIDEGVALEERCFMATLLSPQAAPIMRTRFFSPRDLRRSGHDRRSDADYLDRLRVAHDEEACAQAEDGAMDIKQRLLCRQAIEAVLCLEAGQIPSPQAGDVAAVEELGFPLWTGGPFAWIDAMGAADFIEACDRLRARFGRRFNAPLLVRHMAAEGASFYS
jgi:hypothetical protein